MIFKPKVVMNYAIHLYTDHKTNGISTYGDINTWDVVKDKCIHFIICLSLDYNNGRELVYKFEKILNL